MPIDRSNLDEFTRAYITAALWSSSTAECVSDTCDWRGGDSDGVSCPKCGAPVYDQSLDNLEYGIDDIAEETLTQMIADCATFQQDNAEWIISEYRTHADHVDNTIDSQAGHDFWLTRCGHGCGFWDGDWTEPAATGLTEAGKRYGNVDLYVGDDGRIYA